MIKMKKWIILLCSSLIFSNTCYAVSSCRGGTIIKGKDGTEFCKSNALMSWYAAHAWCYANGGKLATPQKACGKNPGGSCDNMANSVSYNAWGFINYKKKNNQIYQHGRVHLQDKRYNNSDKLNRGVRNASGETHNYGGVTDMYALCE